MLVKIALQNALRHLRPEQLAGGVCTHLDEALFQGRRP